MSGFPDLVLKASGTEGGRLADCNLDGTEGRTWKWVFNEVVDAAGDDIDLSSATAVCKVVDANNYATDVLALTFTGGVGTFTISALASATVALTTANRMKLCAWYLKVTSGSDVVQFWGPSGSRFRIYPED